MYISIAAISFFTLIVVVVLFQFALVIGFPWGEYAMGGRFKGKYPIPMRIAAVFQIFILLLLGVIVIIKARLAFENFHSIAVSGIWLVVGFCILATILNFLTKSVVEKKIWAPISLLLLISSFIVAIG